MWGRPEAVKDKKHLTSEDIMTTETKTMPKAIHIHGRRWFDKVNGNTYHTATIYVDGELVHKIPFSYGYDDHYIQSATEWLDANGYLPDIEHYDNGGTESFWQYCDRNNIKKVTEVDDLPRKKDL